MQPDKHPSQVTTVQIPTSQGVSDRHFTVRAPSQLLDVDRAYQVARRMLSVLHGTQRHYGPKDLVHDALVVALANGSRGYNSAYTYQQYIYCCMRQRVRDVSRQNRRRGVVVSLDDIPEFLATREDVVDEGCDVSPRQLQAAMEGLPSLWKDVLVMQYVEERTFKDIAGVLHRSTKSVASISQNACAAIERLVGELRAPEA